VPVSQVFRGDKLFEPVLKNAMLLTKLGIGGGISAVKGVGLLSETEFVSCDFVEVERCWWGFASMTCLLKKR
jgi:hypothetical protein